MKQKVYNLIVLDASGSMYSIREEAIAGVVETIQTIRAAQKKNEGQEHFLTLVVFNTCEIATVYDRMPIRKVPDFKEKDYQPDAATPLYDAMGQAITHLHRHVCEDDNVLVTIITDGYENDSKEWSHSKIFSLVDKLKESNWLFTYIGANQDALKVARSFGIEHSLNFDADENGTKAMFLRETHSRACFYNKLASGMGFCEAKTEDYFAEEDDETE